MRTSEITRRGFLAAAGAGALTAALPAKAAAQPARPNVLFICVDDLRPQLKCYGKSHMVTPNLDRLAGSGVVFNKHFVQVPTCGASRCSMITGKRPRTRLSLSNGAFEGLSRTDPGKPGAMPYYFQQNGYETVSIGKVTHMPNGRRWPKPAGRYDQAGNMVYSGPDDHEPELAFGWDRVSAPTGEWRDPWSAFFAYAGGKTRSYGPVKSPATEAADVPETGYPDGLIAEAAMKELRGFNDKPFFLAVGFYKPHLPFCAPKKYWDLYNRADIPLAQHPDPPKNVYAELSLHRNGELTGRYDALADPLNATDAEARRLRHGYAACVSYIDAQIGKLLNELDRLGLRENTIVVVWGDHGWHLGDLHVWGKHTTFEFSMRSSLLVRAPGKAPTGFKSDALVETLDLYPTLADCCGLDAPKGLDGTSFAPLLTKPDHPGKDGAFSYWQKGSHKAVTLRTRRYRIVKWVDGDGKTAQVELYDHSVDPDETVNVAHDNPETVEKLLAQLHAESPRLQPA